MLRSLRRATTALALAASLIAVFPSMGGTSSAEGTTPAFGAQFHGMWSSYDDRERALYLDQLAASGATWVRLDVSWAMLQPHSRDAYDMVWGVPFIDRVITMATDRGLKPLVTLWMTPEWANGGAGERALPTDPADYARAAAWAAARWADKVPAWEVWNEPNHASYMTGADPVAYARLLRAAGPAIRAANPQATVVFGGPAGNDSKWLERAYAAGISGAFDVMATHPYQAIADLPPEVPDDGTGYLFTHLAAVHALMERNGDGDKPIWATEFGWSSHPTEPGAANWMRGVTEQQQGEYLVRALQLVKEQMPYVTHMFWFNDHNRSTGSIQNDNYGLFYEDLTPKPVYHALKTYLTSQPAPVEPAPAPAPAPAPEPVEPAKTADLTVELARTASPGTRPGTQTHRVSVANLASATSSARGLSVKGELLAGAGIASLGIPSSDRWTCVVDVRSFSCTSSGRLAAGSAPQTVAVEVLVGSEPVELQVDVRTTTPEADTTNNRALLSVG